MPPRRFPAAAARPRLAPLALALHCAVAAAAAAAAAVTAGGPAHAQGVTQGKDYDIPAGPLADALNRFAQQAGVAIAMDATRVQGLRTPGLKGAYSVESGFNALLRGSGYTVGRTAAGYVLVPAPDKASLPAAGDAVELSPMRVTGARGDMPSEATGDYTVRASRGATGLSLSPRETPQSVSVVTRAQMDDFKLSSVSDVLDATPGVVVERVETDRTYYTARGFNITTFQQDGIGVPFAHGLVGGDLEAAVYDRVEVVRGANGLLSNTGNPSATVNLIRKRPTGQFQASAGATYGSWNDKRLDGDVSGPLNAAGTLRGRFVMARENADSYLDRLGRDKSTVYGVVDADLGENTTVTLGHTYQKNKTRHHVWGGFPLYYSDGSLTGYDRSTNTAADWSYLNTATQDSFLEIAHRFDNGWEAKAVYSHKSIKWDGKLLYVYGVPDRATGLGLFGNPGEYHTTNRQDMLDLRASGPFQLGGRQHELIVGASLSASKVEGGTLAALDFALPRLEDWQGNAPDAPFDIDGGGANFKDKQRSVYAATRLSLTDALTVIVGANATRATSSGANYGTSRARSDFEVTPYAGAVYDIDETLSAYASYTEIFNPQSELDADFKQLDPVTGTNIEAGLKAEFLDKRLTGSAGLFRSKQRNLANYVRTVGTLALYEGTDVTAHGFEAEVAGQVGERLQLMAGYTRLWLEDANGNATRLHTPRHVARLSATYRVPGVEALKVGANLNWRSETSNRGSSLPVTVAQPAYALLNLMARYDITDRVYANLNVNNVTDKKYLTSRYWGDQGYYGAPRSAFLSLHWAY